MEFSVGDDGGPRGGDDNDSCKRWMCCDGDDGDIFA